MATPAAPIKTPLGHDELRRRTRAVGQRLRTILFLVDGRRPLSEVLSLAQQAGAQTCHFEELVRLGLVELPSVAMAPEPVLTAPGGLDTLRVTSVELDLPAASLLPAGGQQTELPFDEIDIVQPRRVDAVEPEPPGAADPIDSVPERADTAASAVPPSAEVLSALASVAAQARERAALSEANASGASHVVAAVPGRSVMPGSMARMPPQPKHRATPPRRAGHREVHGSPTSGAEPAPPHRPKATAPRRAAVRANSRARAELSGEELLQRVRDLMIDTLRLDSPLYRSRTATRVRAAKSTDDLIELVWEIEKRVDLKRHPRNEMISLQRARELLGLGNTIVSSDGVSSQL